MDIRGVKQFTTNLRNYKPGQTILLVDDVKNKIIAQIEFQTPPETLEKVIKIIYTRN